VWVASVDKERRRVALTMIPPGTERARPEKPRRGRRRKPAAENEAALPAAAMAAEAGASPPRAPRVRREAEQRRVGMPGKRRREAGPPQRQPRSATFEKRAAKRVVPLTKAMEEGKEAMRTFGDLLQYHQKKQQQEPTPPAQSRPDDQDDGAQSGSA
jgi:hypothetical protein